MPSHTHLSLLCVLGPHHPRQPCCCWGNCWELPRTLWGAALAPRAMPSSAESLKKKKKRKSRKVRDPQSLYRSSLSCLNSLQLSWRLNSIFTSKQSSAPHCSGGASRWCGALGIAACLMFLQLCWITNCELGLFGFSFLCSYCFSELWPHSWGSVCFSDWQAVW